MHVGTSSCKAFILSAILSLLCWNTKQKMSEIFNSWITPKSQQIKHTASSPINQEKLNTKRFKKKYYSFSNAVRICSLASSSSNSRPSRSSHCRTSWLSSWSCRLRRLRLMRNWSFIALKWNSLHKHKHIYLISLKRTIQTSNFITTKSKWIVLLSLHQKHILFPFH